MYRTRPRIVHVLTDEQKAEGAKALQSLLENQDEAEEGTHACRKPYRDLPTGDNFVHHMPEAEAITPEEARRQIFQEPD